MPPIDWTDEQNRVLAHEWTRHARVLAGPGTGKSATVVAWIDRILSQDYPPRIRLLTFTRAATNELANRVAFHPEAAAERPSTIHSFAISVLLQNGGVGAFPEPLRIADEWETRNIVYPTLSRRINVPVNRIEELFTEAASNWERLEEELSARVDPAHRSRFLGGWREHREAYGYTLLSELPYRLRQALYDHPDLAGLDYNVLVVDEYQDLNACDLDVLRRIADRDCTILAIGDDDQSIYSFRRAAPEGIRRFPDEYNGCEDYPLSITHRCGRRIMEWAAHVIRGDTSRDPEKTDPHPIPGSPEGEIGLLSFAGHASEAAGVASLVQHLIEDEELSPSDILVLLRTDHHGNFSNPIKAALENLNIEVSNPNAVKELLAEEDNRRLLANLRLLANNNDSLAWATLFKMEHGIGPTFTNAIYDRACVERVQFGEIVLNVHDEDYHDFPAVIRNRVRSVVELVLNRINNTNLPDITPEDGWASWILNFIEADGTFQVTEDFRDLLVRVDTRMEQEQSLGQFISQIMPLAKDIAQTTSEGVRIMTMTASKGLTVKATIIPGLEEGVLPRRDANLNEERRLLFVAMTRSKRFLFGTWARMRRGPTARAGDAAIGRRRSCSSFVAGGPVESQDGDVFIRLRWNH